MVNYNKVAALVAVPAVVAAASDVPASNLRGEKVGLILMLGVCHYFLTSNRLIHHQEQKEEPVRKLDFMDQLDQDLNGPEMGREWGETLGGYVGESTSENFGRAGETIGREVDNFFGSRDSENNPQNDDDDDGDSGGDSGGGGCTIM